MKALGASNKKHTPSSSVEQGLSDFLLQYAVLYVLLNMYVVWLKKDENVEPAFFQIFILFILFQSHLFLLWGTWSEFATL